jgi:drug/metabolite transporter (DMT)-like permease
MTDTVSIRKGIILMLLSVVFFSANCLIIRGLGLFANVDGWMSSFTRGLAGTIFVVAFYSRRGLELSHLRKPLVIARGILGVTGITLLYFTIIHLGAGRALVLNLTYPLFGALFAAIWLREAVKPQTFGLLMVALTGLLIFFSDSFRQASLGLYDLLGLAGAAVAGATVVVIRTLTRTESAPTIYSSQCFVTLLVAGPIAAPDFFTTSPLAWGLLLLAGVVVAYGQILITRGFYHLSVAQRSGIQMLIPILTSAGGFFLFQETLTPMELCGAAVTLFATWRISAVR